ncbi:MAG: hypothetical protein Q7W56_12470 [Candidatus Latescibacteria bacterium]|nr:hypothetical protein [Candidatus Latescibacterota bacterium]
MRSRQSYPFLLAAGLLVAASVQAAPAAQSDPSVRMRALRDVIIPADWAGIWQISSQTYICNPEQLINSGSYPDTLCAGSALDFDFGQEDFTLTCDGTVDGNTMTAECTGSAEAFPGCTANYHYMISSTRNGGSYVSTTTITTTYVGGACEGQPESCMRIEAVGTRIDDAPETCVETPLETLPWGAVKAAWR